MKRIRDIFRCPRSFRLRSFRPRCLCVEDDDIRCQSAEEVYHRSGYSDAGLKPEPEVPAEPSETFVQFILPGQCEELTTQEELTLLVNPELKLQVEELLGTPETTSICEFSESEEEVHVPIESEVEPEIEAPPDPPEAASSSDFVELEEDLHELQCMFDAIFDFPEAPCFSDLSNSEEEQHVLAEPEVEIEIEALTDAPKAASSSDFAQLEEDLQELQCMFDEIFDFPEAPCFSDLSNSEEEQHVLAEPEVETEIEALTDPPQAASSSDSAEVEQDLHELQCEVEAFLGSSEVHCFSDLSDSEEVLYVRSESEVDTESGTLSILSEATSSLQDFRCCAVLGEGAFGKVLLAEYKQTQDMFAIKAITKANVIRRKHTERLRCEKDIFQTVSSARHPFLVNLFTSFQDERYIFFVMEYAAGGDLLSNKPRITESFPEDRAVFYAACVVLGLEFLHQNKIIHRDLKLENVVLDKEGFAKLTDFGLSKAGIGFGDRTKSIVGTPLYMAPEIMSWQPYTRDVDWWSFGILIYDMLAEHTPFDAHNRVKLNHNIATSEVPYPHDWSPESISLVSQLLVKNPTQRLGSSEKGAEEVKTHPFFRGIEWRKLFLRELRPPFLPPLSGPKDVSNFDTVFTSLAPVLTPPEGPGLTEEQQELFKDFDWTAEWAR